MVDTYKHDTPWYTDTTFFSNYQWTHALQVQVLLNKSFLQFKTETKHLIEC